VKNVSFDEAIAKFEAVFNLASGGEFVIITRDDQRVIVHSLPASGEPEVAPAGYFAKDYDSNDFADLNALASQGPKSPIP
jgi:hypothetical protein